ncbi:MAG: hypothetical protein AAF511_03720 [Pseudomonadota bacterium]
MDSDIALYASGVLGVFVSIVHGYIGEMKVVRPSEAPSAAAKRVLSAIMFLSAVYWLVVSLLLIATPAYVPDGLRAFAAYGAGAVLLSGALGNLWATRGRHPGWMLLTVAAGLAFIGA